VAKVDRDASQDTQLAEAKARMRANLEAADAEARGETAKDGQPEPKEKVTVYLAADLIGRVRGAVMQSKMQGGSVSTNSELFTQALEAKLDTLVLELKPAGGEFAIPSGKLSGGRPPKKTL